MERISQQTIDEIMQATDIVDVIGEYVQLQPSGKSFKGLCPFHHEKTPSFYVSKDKHIFNCFGCGEKGNAAGFLMKYKNWSYVESLKYLADRYHIPLEIDVGRGTVDKSSRLFEINQTASDYYQLALTHLEAGKPALSYLKKRGMDVQTIQYFEIGFAPSEYDTLYKNLKTKYQELDLLEVGLVKKSAEGHFYDLFRNRILFPIKNINGKIVGFSGRIYQPSETEPKYVNSPYTTLFTKGQILYHLDKAIPFIKQMKRAVLYEGFMDVIASVRAGIKEAVATMGTALTIDQANQLKKVTNHVVLCYDGDRAGFEAMIKAISILENAKLQVTLVVLPDNLDPDEYVQKLGVDAYQTVINTQQIDPFEFKYLAVRQSKNLHHAGSVEQLKMAVFDMLKDSSATMIELFLKRLAKDTSVDYETIRTDYHSYKLSKAILASKTSSPSGYGKIAVINRAQKAELSLLAYYAKDAFYRQRITDELPGFYCYEELNQEIFMTMQDILETKQLNSDLTEYVIARFKPEKQFAVRKVLTNEHDYSLTELDDDINQMKARKIEEDIADLREQQQTIGSDDKSRYHEINQEIISLVKRKDSLWTKKKPSKH